MSTMAISGGGISAQLMYAMDELSRGLRSDQRERAEQESNQALREGLAEANELHEKAELEVVGAIVGASLTAAGGFVQFAAAQDMKVPGKGAQDLELKQIDAFNKPLTAAVSGGGTVATLGKISQDIFAAQAGHHEANAREHSARAQAASRKADTDQSAAQESKQMSDKARELHSQLMSLEHAGTMAALNIRG